MSPLRRFAWACGVRFVLSHYRPGFRLPVLVGQAGASVQGLDCAVRGLREVAAAMDSALLEFKRQARRKRRKPTGGQFKRRGRRLGVR